MRPFRLLPVFIALAGTASAQSTLPPEDPAQPYQISVSLNLVALQATVLDRKGGFAAGLDQQNFQVFEDGVRQNIRLFRHEDVPVTVGLVVDHSGSMRVKLPEVMIAAKTFVQASNPEDQMFVINFNEKVSLGLPAAVPFSNRADELESAIGNQPAAGETALYDAISVALNRLKSGTREKKVLIVISDGGDNASRLDLAGVLKMASQSNAVVYAIGIFDKDDPDQNPGVLRRLAKETGGEAFFPAEFDDTAAICGNIAKDIRHQYTLGYVSGNALAHGQRTIRVIAKAAGKDLVVRTRTEYIANQAGK